MNKAKTMWDNRYSANDYAYGISPNEFFKDILSRYNLTGKILLPAEGEGRNAVYAAKMGLEVIAFDISDEGRKKALELAKNEQVEITYEVGDFFELDLHDSQFDSAALIYAHFPPPLLSKYHKRISDLVKSNGLIILEGFSKNNIKYRDDNPNIGGPKEISYLFSKESIRKDFSDFEVIQLEEVEVELKEGNYHNGTGSVIRFIGRKYESDSDI